METKSDDEGNLKSVKMTRDEVRAGAAATMLRRKNDEDPLFLDRLQRYFKDIKEQYDLACKDPTVTPPEFERLRAEVKTYGSMLDWALQRVQPVQVDPFAEANKNAQAEEVIVDPNAMTGL